MGRLTDSPLRRGLRQASPRHRSTGAREIRQHSTQLGQFGRLAEHAIHMLGPVVFCLQSISPAGEQYHRHIGSAKFDGGCDCPTIHVGHSKIGNHHVIRCPALLRGTDFGIDIQFINYRSN